MGQYCVRDLYVSHNSTPALDQSLSWRKSVVMPCRVSAPRAFVTLWPVAATLGAAAARLPRDLAGDRRAPRYHCGDHRTARPRPGDTVLVDGIVLEGATSADESTLTGAAHPRHARQGRFAHRLRTRCNRTAAASSLLRASTLREISSSMPWIRYAMVRSLTLSTAAVAAALRPDRR